MTTHDSYRITHVAKRPGAPIVAVCSCGWRSDPAVNGGMAGAAWDQHVVDTTTESETQR